MIETAHAGMVHIPEITSGELLDRALKTTGGVIGERERELRSWDFIRGQAGRAFEVEKWTLNDDLGGRAIQSALAARGLVGNVAAFLCWLQAQRPKGLYVTIPVREELFESQHGLSTLTFLNQDGRPRPWKGRMLRPHISLSLSVYVKWHKGWTVAAFREKK